MFKKTYSILLIAIPLILGTMLMLVSAAPFIGTDGQNTASSERSLLSAEEAESIVLTHLGLTRENIRFERSELDRKRGRTVWNIEFAANGVEYSFEIDAYIGEIVKTEREENKKPSSAPPVTTEPTPNVPAEPTPEVSELTKDQAIEIALNDAGLTRDQVRELEIEKDRENGVLVYEVEFENGRTEYSYEIRISDGKVLTRSIDIDD